MLEWKVALARLFAATVNQEPLEDAADVMVSVSVLDSSYHTECLAALNGGIHAGGECEMEVMSAINKSGYKVHSFEEAKELLQEFLDIYERRYEELGKR